MKRTFCRVFFYLLFCSVTTLVGQDYIYNYNIPFIENGRLLQYPLAGGINNPQFSSIDINQDGKKDIFMFDRSGNKPMVLINNGITGEMKYTYWQGYESIFPKMTDWCVLIDYNCDGLEDIITAGLLNRVKTYLANYDGTNIYFTEDISELPFKESGFSFFISVGIIDIPGFADINFDGDIDVLTFNMAGGIVDYYENQQVEDGLPCGTWALEHVNSCWGNFYESGITYSVDLNQECKGVTSNTSAVHAGSSFLIFDEDADSDMDIVLGDLAFNNLNRLINGGDNAFANIIEQDTTFPEYDKPYDIPIFPAAFLIDVDNDNKKDMLVAPNNINQSANVKNVWFYKNVAADDTYIFDYQQDSLFVSEVVDLGSGAYPVFFDYNYDGLQDLVIGNNGYFESGDYNGMLALYENTGSAEQPEYTLITRDFGGISAFGFNWLAPAFGDLDGDGDEDLLLGEEEGWVHYFKNIGPPDGPASFILMTPNYQGIDFGKFSTPQLFDVNDDGLPDLILGEQNGNLNYFENTGTASTPEFTLQSEFWGNVDVRAPGQVFGSSTPWMYKNSSGEKTLYVGCENGTIYQYAPSADFTGAFTKVTSAFSGIDDGNYSSLAMADIDDDNYPDIVTGNLRGGITMYRNVLSTPVINLTPKSEMVQVYPNPFTTALHIISHDDWNFNAVALYSLDGKIQLIIHCASTNTLQLNVEHLPSGFYTVVLSDTTGNKIVKSCIKP